ncbi:thiamine-phosphate kinase [Tepidicella baoligensis]|uniref:thiamine-phosphate kinase n=1 Tax=Tepidicella baoligensis TaxID=2707016 RepID=UPI0015DBA205|nr:thiamine-phosphate kinase [Tepidicella baoligensis]
MGEFDLIRRHFQHALRPAGVTLGNGDDAALLAPAPGCQLAVSTDMLVEGRHFLPTVDPRALGHKALAVNLSDLAAMGARPLACTLALALPRADDAWLSAFASGLLALADAHGCALVGGDTTAGPLNLCLTVMGEVPWAQALRRDAARVGDDVYVSGALGDARLALEVFRGRCEVPAAVFARARRRMEWPEPRVALGLALRGVAHACADVSDGLLGDLGHILRASGVAARIDAETLMRSEAVSDGVRTLDAALALTCVLAGGDDYELVFTAPASARQAVAQAALEARIAVTRIGEIVPAQDGVCTARLVNAEGDPFPIPAGAALAGFDHFA